MSSTRWNIASAKAELSRVVRQARRTPQLLERRGKPVAVVMGMDSYQRVVEKEAGISRWRALLSVSADLRAAGGATLRLPQRKSRQSQLRW
jgi:prevent-host-death family protein